MIRDEVHTALQHELAGLESAERPWLLSQVCSTEGWDAADRAHRIACALDLARLDARIHHLRRRLLDLGSAEACDHPLGGMTVEVDFGDGPETYLLGDFSYAGLPVITPTSPLGRALVGTDSGQVVTYSAPRGPATVLLLAVGGADEHAA